MQLRVVALALLVAAGVLGAGRAAADQMPQNGDGEVQFRGNYWRDRNTRVINPVVDIDRRAPNGVRVGASYVLDAITSASVAAGATNDQPFTELRHEAGLRVEVPLGWRDGHPSRHSISANYTYSSESDYWSQSAGLRLKLNLFQDNTALVFGGDYSHNIVARRMGPDRYLVPPPSLSPTCQQDASTLSFADREGCLGILHLFHFVVLGTQVFSPTMLGTLSYEITAGFGDWNNPYRPVLVSGQSQRVENLPRVRVRNVVAGSLRKLLRIDNGLVPFVTLRPALRLFFDSWGLKAMTPELAVHVPVGPLEVRALYAFYGQLGAWFYRSDLGGRTDLFPNTPSYANGAASQNGGEGFFTGDVKLGSYTTHTAELSLRWRLTFLGERKLFGEAPLSRTIVELTGGAWFADRAVGWQYGIPLSGGDPQAPAGCSLVCAAFYGNLGLSLPL